MPELQTGSYHANNFVRAFRRWFVPYAQSRVMPDKFRPLLSYLFTEWKCNAAAGAAPPAGAAATAAGGGGGGARKRRTMRMSAYV